MSFEDAPGGARVQVHLGADLARDPGDPVQRQAAQVVTLAGQRD